MRRGSAVKLLVCTAALCAAALCAATQLGMRPPRSRLARDVGVFGRGAAPLMRIREPGRYELACPCSYVAGETERLTLDVTIAGADGPSYRACDEQAAAALALQGGRQAVEFAAPLVAMVGGPPEQPAPAAGGGEVRYAFLTAAGIHGFVPAHQSELLRLARALVPGDVVTVRGTLLLTASGRAAVLADELSLERDAGPVDEPPWTLTVHWGAMEVAVLSEPRRLPMQVPCLHREGAVERVAVTMREFKETELVIGEHRVAAELADTPELRRWGLQGRAGLGPDEGMLFYFPETLWPGFVMMTVSFPISIAFIRADGVITNVAHLNPGDTHTVTSPMPVTYVLEITQGWFAERQLGPGSRVRIP